MDKQVLELKDILWREFTAAHGELMRIEPHKFEGGVQSRSIVQVVWLHADGKEFFRFKMPSWLIIDQIKRKILTPREVQL